MGTRPAACSPQGGLYLFLLQSLPSASLRGWWFPEQKSRNVTPNRAGPVSSWLAFVPLFKISVPFSETCLSHGPSFLVVPGKASNCNELAQGHGGIKSYSVMFEISYTSENRKNN